MKCLWVIGHTIRLNHRIKPDCDFLLGFKHVQRALCLISLPCYDCVGGFDNNN